MPVLNSFKWDGVGVAPNRRKSSELHYQAFHNGSLFVSIEDYVLICNEDSTDPEDPSTCYIAQVMDLYDKGEGDEPYKAQVMWYSRVTELQPSFIKRFREPHCEYEVVEEHHHHWDNIIDAESIFGKCVVMFLPVDSDPSSQPFKSESGTPMFYCRYKLTGVKLCPKVQQHDQQMDNVTPQSTRRHRSAKQNEFIKKESYDDSNLKNSEKITMNGMKLKSLVISVPKVEDLIIGNSVEDHKDIFSPKKRFKVDESSLSSTRIKIRALNISDDECDSKTNTQNSELKNAGAALVQDTILCQSPVSRFHCASPVQKSVNSLRQTPSGARSSPRLRKNTVCDEKTKMASASQVLSTPEVKYLTPTRNSSRRALNFIDGENKEDNSVTTRYGRKVKSVTNLSSALDLLLTPEKARPEKREVTRKKFYHSDASDSDESVYKPIDSSSDESGRDSPVDQIHHKQTPAVKKKYSRLNTPSTRKKLQSPLTPSLPPRRQPVKTPSNALEESRQRLHVSSVPSSLPCRDEEYSDIYAFIESNLVNQTGGCMYVSGVPGTGKTATVHEVIRNLEAERDCGSLPSFQFIEVNGMKMTDPYQCYVQIFKALTGQRIAPQQAASMLEKRFTKPGPKHDAIILLVDELDKLWTRKQTVMYNIFDWPTKQGSKLIVVAIANTMDLPERMMMTRVSSRLGLTRKTFQPYTYRELQEIVMSRIQELHVFDPDAVQLVARKVAAVSGDARRALEICRRAAEIAEEGNLVIVSPSKKKNILVGMGHVDAALNQMLSSPEVAAIRGCSELQKVFFKALLAEFERTGNEETTLFKLYRQFLMLCRLEGLHPPTTSQASAICSHLASSYLILVDNFDNDLFMKIRLNVSIDDVSYALNGYTG